MGPSDGAVEERSLLDSDSMVLQERFCEWFL